ncbi:MAG TPA: hypothetical protein VGI35_00670, partial [Steroidobacteraceae bacterium]
MGRRSEYHERGAVVTRSTGSTRAPGEQRSGRLRGGVYAAAPAFESGGAFEPELAEPSEGDPELAAVGGRHSMGSQPSGSGPRVVALSHTGGTVLSS